MGTVTVDLLASSVAQLAGRCLATISTFAWLTVVPVLAAAQSAPSGTPYQEQVVNKSCVGATSCKFVFPAPKGALTIIHVSCNLVTTLTPSEGDGNLKYLALGTSAANAPVDYIDISAGYNGVSPYYYTQAVENTVYFVPANVTPEINAQGTETIALPHSYDEPSCFISGYIS
jgi:hypothetical protein